MSRSLRHSLSFFLLAAGLSCLALYLQHQRFSSHEFQKTKLEQPVSAQATESAVRITSATPSPAQVFRRIFEALPRLNQLGPGSLVFLTFTNGHYSELMLNAAVLIARTGRPLVVLSFDDEAAQLCEDLALPHMPSEDELTGQDFRQNQHLFLKMGALKAKAVLKLFRERNVTEVALVDTDTAWMRDPSAFLQRHPAADIFVSTDCLSHKVELTRQPNNFRCGHVPGSSWAFALNTGILIWRNRPATVAFLEAWINLMENGENSRKGMDDQLSFNIMAQNGAHLPIKDVASDEWVFEAGPPTSPVRIMVLPSVLFGNGKTFFFQAASMHERYGVSPYVVHATFQRQLNAGKRSRFREAGLFVVDPPERFTEGRFLTYDNNVQEFIAAMQSGVQGGRLEQLHAHMLAAAYQHAAFRDAMAMAVALDRILVVPRIYGWCDHDVGYTILVNCSTAGSEMDLPYAAPMDLLFNVAVLDALPGSSRIRYREWSFLDKPEVPASLKNDRETVTLLWPHAPAANPRASIHGVYVPMGFDDRQLKDATAAVHSARVLSIRNHQPGAFKGFVEAKDARQIDDWYGDMRAESKWCCSSEVMEHKRKGWASWDWILPAPLASGPQRPWKVPQIPRPAWCDELRNISTEVQGPLRYANHPCNFLDQNLRFPPWPAV